MKVPEKYYDEVFDFMGQWEVWGKCGLKIVDYRGKKIIIVTELYQDNPGTSITYNATLLIKQIVQKKGFDINNITYIECNPNTNSVLSFYDEEFFEVSFDFEDNQFKNPKYRQISSEEIREIIPIN
ncbi:MAG: hypothetical protein PHN41_04535 [Bacteroidales bacterium]|jgi:hypothetical protein|nr:hypothetical protein [Bacteroidales bacterium]MDD4703721.1 hypothetical protein [Bacteroidales bacterium]MDX9798066.1 hypothetical protein [Bacteroidales bacterium]